MVLIPAFAVACALPTKSATGSAQDQSSGTDDGGTVKQGDLTPSDSDDAGAPVADAAPAEKPDVPPAANVLDEVNLFRKAANLPDVTQDPTLSAAAIAHATYMVRADKVTHDEDKASPYYSKAGYDSGMKSDILATDRPGSFDTSIEFFAKAPFHALQFMDPGLKSVGFGDFTEKGAGFIYAAVLNVQDGLDKLPKDAHAEAYPIMFPSDGAVTPIREAVNEYPNPLAPCKGYTYPAGLPIIVQLAPGKGGAVKAHSLMSDGKPVEHCVIDQNTYTNTTDPDFLPGTKQQETAQQHGREILKASNAVVIIPRAPLAPKASYSVSVEVGDEKLAWSFKVANNAR
jgi:uncharacterized protein YkwD